MVKTLNLGEATIVVTLHDGKIVQGIIKGTTECELPCAIDCFFTELDCLKFVKLDDKDRTTFISSQEIKTAEIYRRDKMMEVVYE
jgi:hypothetical protein